MRTRRHPLSRAVYDVRDDGLVEVTAADGTAGVFDHLGRWVSGELHHVDPQLCGWLAGPQLPEGVDGNLKDFRPESTAVRPESTDFGPESTDLGPAEATR